MSLRLLGTGGALPSKVLTNEMLSTMVDTNDEWIFSHTGINTRHLCAPGENTLTMGVQAARIALSSANMQAKEISLIICHTVSPSAIVPSLACQIMREIGAQCPAFDINAACTGFLYALSIADAMAKGPVLIICSEQMSSIIDYTDRSMCILFGDAAGAVVVEPGEGLLHLEIRAIPDTLYTLDCQGVNHKDERGNLSPSYMHMDGPEVFKFATREVISLLTTALSATGLSKEDLAYIVPHQANLRIIKSSAERMKIPLEKFYVNIDRTGNSSSATIPFALYELCSSGKVKKGDKLLLVGFGAGWTSGSAILTI